MEIYVVKAGDTLGTTAACRYISKKETDLGDDIICFLSPDESFTVSYKLDIPIKILNKLCQILKWVYSMNVNRLKKLNITV